MWGRTLRGALSDEGILPIYIGKSERWRDFQAPEARIEWVRRGMEDILHLLIVRENTRLASATTVHGQRASEI